MNIRQLAALGFLLLASSCTALKSTPMTLGDGRAPEGMHYALPKGVFRIELIAAGDEVFLAVSEPVYIGDPEATFALDASSGLFASQEYVFFVDPSTRLLSYVNSVSKGEAGAILTNLGRLAGASQGFSAESSRGDTGERVIYSKLVDPFKTEGCTFGSPCGFGAITEELRARAMDYLDCERDTGGPRRYAICARLASSPGFFQISLDPMFGVKANAGARAERSPSSCRKSVCYRAAAPYALNVRVEGLTDASELVMLPNESPVMSMDVPAAVFAESRARLELLNGMPARYRVSRKNELVAITATPLNIMKGFFGAFSEVVQLRINFNTDRRNLATSNNAYEDFEDEDAAADADRAASRRAATGPALLGDVAENSRGANMQADQDPATDSFGDDILAGAEVDPAQAGKRLFRVPLVRTTAAAAPAGQSASGATLK